MIWQRPCFIPPYIQLNQNRLLWSSVIGYSGVWNKAKIIYLTDHQTTAFQCPMPKVTFIESAQYTLHILVQRFSSFINLINSIYPFTYTRNIRKQAWNQLSQWPSAHAWWKVKDGCLFDRLDLRVMDTAQKEKFHKAMSQVVHDFWKIYPKINWDNKLLNQAPWNWTTSYAI